MGGSEGPSHRRSLCWAMSAKRLTTCQPLKGVCLLVEISAPYASHSIEFQIHDLCVKTHSTLNPLSARALPLLFLGERKCFFVVIVWNAEIKKKTFNILALSLLSCTLLRHASIPSKENVPNICLRAIDAIIPWLAQLQSVEGIDRSGCRSWDNEL